MKQLITAPPPPCHIFEVTATFMYNSAIQHVLPTNLWEIANINAGQVGCMTELFAGI